MRRNVFNVMVGLFVAVVFGMAGCGGGGGDSAPATYNISGAVSGDTLAGVTINLTGAATASATTDASGNFSFTGQSNGTYTVTPVKTGYTFNPASSVAIVSGASVTNTNFVATANGASTYSISGTVAGAVQAGVSITLNGSTTGTAVTNASGNYSFSGLADGNYTVTPSLTGYTFTPANLSITLSSANSTGNNFTSVAVPPPATYSISGAVSGATLTGVTINLTGAGTTSTTTDASGNFSITGLANGAYTVTPVKAGYTFTPSSSAVNVSGANITGTSFVASANPAPTYTISGAVSGAVLSGVTITLSGAGSATTTTNASGNYSFSGIANGNYTVTPSMTGYTFSPASRSTTVSGANLTGQDFTVTISGRLVAGTIQLPQTGQTSCYDASGSVISCTGSGQDGDIRAGVPWPEPRFLDNGDQTVTDNLTGLMWTMDANLIKTRDPAFDTDYSGSGDGAVSWQQALDYVKKLDTENYLGFNNWRLPNRNELSSIITLDQPNTINWLKTQGFTNFPTGYGWYWSSSNATGSACGVQLSGGAVSRQLPKVDGRYYVWPIRDSQSVPSGAVALPVTGQATCYNANGNLIACTGTGQDGELQKGVAWPTARFTDNGDQTITDNLTGLIWTKDANAPGPITCPYSTDSIWRAKPWQGALDYVKCLNSNSYLGKSDWRLPNRNELASLVNPGQNDNSTWLQEQGFSSVQTSYNYWSADTGSSSYGYAWSVNLRYGDVSDTVKNIYYYVWPVR